jgi:hypothetical protein
MDLSYLIFDATDNTDGTGTWEAMASVRGEQLPAVMTEVEAVMALAERTRPGPRGPLDEGGLWDAEVQTQADGDWTTVTLSLTGPLVWGEDLLRRLMEAG